MTNPYAQLWTMPEHPPTQLFAAAGNALQKAFSSKKTCPAWMEAIVKGVVADPEVSIRPSVSAILDMDISVDLKTQKPSISGKTVTLYSRCATEGAGTYERQLTQACEDNLAQINPLLKQKIKNALVI